jgi:hypothetical protein
MCRSALKPATTTTPPNTMAGRTRLHSDDWADFAFQRSKDLGGAAGLMVNAVLHFRHL